MSLECRGTVAPGFEPVRHIFQTLLTRGWDIGSAFSVFMYGKPVVNLFGGVRDKSIPNSLPYNSDTIQLVASNTKFIESLCIALLVDRGLLCYDDTIVDHWSEFANDDAQKAKVTVRQLMMHRAGLPVFERPLTDAELFNLEVQSKFLERQKLISELFQPEPVDENWRSLNPAPPQAYHAVSRGLYASQLLRRVDPKHRTLGQFFQDEFARPLGLQFWIGLPESEEHRVAAIHPASGTIIMKLLENQANTDLEPNDPRYQLFDYELQFFKQFLTQPNSIPHRALNCLAPDNVPPDEIGNHRKIRACELPSSNGVGNAESLAKLAALAVGYGVLEKQKVFSKPDTLKQATQCADFYASDGMMLTQVQFTQGGFAQLLAWDDLKTITFGWGGAGGQMVRFVPELDLGCAYLTNTAGIRMAMNDPRANELLKSTIECARQLQG
ncbi:MAG: beta-lactamase family protein [Iphinoe sp. HA4291-MV1]|jgi:CubicO group peptidase (beta-lactamase class C family)|nr:beta-lactamase family protein [Iphinoe sp. HA4291-MV1]